MKLVAIAALFAVCGAAKLDRMYLPPASAITAGGNSDSLLTPLVKSSSDQGESSVPSGRLPTGSYTNNFQGVVVDAATAGIRASSDSDQSGLGGPRDSYGSTNSKVGDAAFKGSIAGFRNTPSYDSSGSIGQSSGISTGQNFGTFESKSERPQAFKDRNSNIITYANDISPDNYSYGFETDNGIAIGENGVANNGIQAQGGYSYKGDDGQVYKVTYVADEGGYRPQGDHLPTPPPIPKEILVSLEQNAKDEAAGLIDDGSYDAQKYNAEGDYTHHNSGNIQYNGAQSSQFAKRPESDATASNTFINQQNQPFGKPGQLGHIGVHNTHSNYSGPSNQFNENKFGSNNANNQNSLAGSLDNQSSQTQSQSQESSVAGLHSSGHFQHSQQNSGSQLTSHIGQAQGLFESQTSQFDTQKNQQVPVSQFETGSSQFGSQIFQQGSVNHLGGQPSHNNQQFAGQASQVGSTSQFGVQPGKPLLGQNPNSAFNYQMNQGTQFGSQPFNPQSFFGKPSQHSDDKQTQTQVSQIQFATENSNKPTFSSFSSNKPLPVIPNQAQTIINNENRFPNSPTQFGYEYNKPQANEVSSPQETNPNNQIADIVPLEGQNQGFSQGSSASAFASVGPVGLEIQPAKPFNAFQPQIPGLSQFNYNNNNQLISQGQNVPTPALAAGTKPTAIPDTELTTPFGPNEKPISSQESQFNSESADNFGNFGFQSLNNQKPQNTLHQNSASSFAHSRPQEVFQFGSSVPTQDVFPAAQQPGSSGGKPQFPQHSFVQNQQNALSQNNNNGYFSTQKPSIIQESHDSYYYNQPSKPFSIPGTHSQDSKFPNSPYQSNSLVSSQNNQFSNQQESSSTKLPVPPSIATVSPTSFPLTPAPGGPSNYYSGITQASVSSFPSVSPTTLSQYDNIQENQFGSKPSINQPTAGSINLLNRPTNSQPNTAVPSFPSKPATTFGQRPSTSFTQNQIQFGQSSLSNSIQPSSSQLSPAKPMSTFGQTPSSSFTQNQIQLGQSTSTSNDQSQTPAVGQEQQTTSTLTQQYQGTVYEYNKPAEVLPTPAKSDSSSSQSVQINSAPKPQKELAPENQESKPHYSSQQTQFGQSTFSSQSQQSTLNQGAKPQFGMTFKPFGSSSSNNAQIEQKPQSTSSQTSLHHINQGFQITEQAVKPIETELSATQFGQSSQASLGSRPQFGTQSFGTTISSTQFGQNTKQKQSAEISSSNQTQEAQSTIQPFKPFGGLQTTSQFGQNTQSSFGSITQNTGYQFAASPNRPFGSTSNPSQSGEALHNQGSHPTGFSSSQHNTPSLSTGSQPYKPFGTIGLTQGAQPIKPFGTAGTNQGFQGYPSSKPQFGTQTQTQLTQSSQQTFGTTQVIQPAGGLHTDTFPVTPFASDSTVSNKPQFGQNIQPNQGTQTSFGSFQSSQFGSSTSNPQFETQAQIGQAHENGSPVKPFGSVSSSAHFSQNSAESSSSMTQQQPSSAQAYKPNENYKPFGATFAQNSDFQSHKQPQFDQAPQPSHGSTTVSPSHFSAQPLKPFNNGPQGSKDKPEVPQNKPFGTQGSPCCQDSKDSSIAPLNVGKPSQAFAQTQSQFTGFQGVQNLNAQAVAGKGEEFGGPRQPPSFDSQTGYHY